MPALPPRKRSWLGGTERRPERGDEDDAPFSRSDLSKGAHELRGDGTARISWSVLLVASTVILAFSIWAMALPDSASSSMKDTVELVVAALIVHGFQEFHHQVAIVEAPVPTFGGTMARETDVYYRPEVFTQKGSGVYDLMGLTRQQVIDDVLERYEAYLAALTLSTPAHTASEHPVVSQDRHATAQIACGRLGMVTGGGENVGRKAPVNRAIKYGVLTL